MLRSDTFVAAHRVPVYLCGAKQQDKAIIPAAAHAQLHSELSASALAARVVLKQVMKRIDKYLKRPGKGGRKSTDPIVLLAEKRMGRSVIGNFLDLFYNTTSYGGTSYYAMAASGSESKGRLGTLGAIFEVERIRFINGITSVPTCKQ